MSARRRVAGVREPLAPAYPRLALALRLLAGPLAFGPAIARADVVVPGPSMREHERCGAAPRAKAPAASELVTPANPKPPAPPLPPAPPPRTHPRTGGLKSSAAAPLPPTAAQLAKREPPRPHTPRPQPAAPPLAGKIAGVTPAAPPSRRST